jgi:DNA-binding LacI/PurR family transcriptional regulator
VTLREVAAAAGVTAITVSRYLRQPGLVAPATAEAIQTALSATGYVPNKQAGVLASGRGSIVAALVPNLAHSIFAETLQGLSRKLEAAGLELLVAASGYSVEREEAQIRALLGWAPRALVVTGRHHTPGALKLLRARWWRCGTCTRGAGTASHRSASATRPPDAPWPSTCWRVATAAWPMWTAPSKATTARTNAATGSWLRRWRRAPRSCA